MYQQSVRIDPENKTKVCTWGFHDVDGIMTLWMMHQAS